jgi:diguanylate cyclase (GGDEF)-like protein
MVTVAAPIFAKAELIGVATVDLKLEGLKDSLARVAREFDGYAFAVDRHGHLLSFPDTMLAGDQSPFEGGKLSPYVKLSELADRVRSFETIERLLQQQLSGVMALEAENPEVMSMASQIAQESDQIQPVQASYIAASIFTNGVPESAMKNQAVLENDYLLKERAYVSITTMPGTLWQIVAVMPDSAARAEAVNLFNQLISVILVAILIAMLMVMFVVRYQFTLPLTHLSRQLKNSLSKKSKGDELIEVSDKGELGALAALVNRRTSQLLLSQQQIEKLAFYDPLTGLPNRRLLIDRLDELLAIARRSVCSGAVLFLDLDHFKHINDSLGHSVGDEVLRQISDRLRLGVRDQDVISRIGGDEFVIVLVYDNIGSNAVASNAMRVSQKLIDILSKPFEVLDSQHFISASIGISLFSGQTESTEDLLKRADTAMYQAKSNGRNTFCFFEQKMQASVDRRLQIEKELRHVIDRNELVLEYQPQLNAKGQCVGAEALLRWNHPEKGKVVPTEFIPVAEDSVLILQLGHWVIREACRHMKMWLDDGLDFDHIAINVSPRQFQQGDIVGEIHGALTHFGVPSNKLMIEITEGIIVNHTEETIDKMLRLKALGVRISVDDFGTGYSSLLYLKQLPLSQLKIDQSFVRDLASDENDLIIVETILSMANHLSLDVVAEGVETEEQYLLLKNRGCQSFQGYFFSRPVAAQQLANCFMEPGCCYGSKAGGKTCPIKAQVKDQAGNNSEDNSDTQS